MSHKSFRFGASSFATSFLSCSVRPDISDCSACTIASGPAEWPTILSGDSTLETCSSLFIGSRPRGVTALTSAAGPFPQNNTPGHPDEQADRWAVAGDQGAVISGRLPL